MNYQYSRCWRRTPGKGQRGGWGGETKAKNLAPTWTAPRLLCSSTFLLYRKEVDPAEPRAQVLDRGGTGGWLRPEVRQAEETAASAFHSLPSILPASSGSNPHSWSLREATALPNVPVFSLPTHVLSTEPSPAETIEGPTEQAAWLPQGSLVVLRVPETSGRKQKS